MTEPIDRDTIRNGSRKIRSWQFHSLLSRYEPRGVTVPRYTYKSRYGRRAPQVDHLRQALYEQSQGWPVWAMHTAARLRDITRCNCAGIYGANNQLRPVVMAISNSGRLKLYELFGTDDRRKALRELQPFTRLNMSMWVWPS